MVKALCEYTSEELSRELTNRSGDGPAIPRVSLVPSGPLKLDLGCGTKKQEGHIGVDSLAFDGVDVVCNVGKDPWPWDSGSVESVHCSHMLEHLTAGERTHFANELFRVLKPGGVTTIITPHWNSPRAYGDLTHAWPPVSEWWFLYLSADWRKLNAPHNTGYTCDFPMPTIGYSPSPALNGRNGEYVNHAVQYWRGAADDMCATLTKPAAK